MDSECSCTDVGFITSYEGHELLPVIVRLISRGEAVSPAEIARAAGRDAGWVEALLRAQPGTDWDANGALAGFGLTLVETPYRLRIAGRVLYTWCATDTLFFPAILGTTATAESVCPSTGATIRVAMDPDSVISVDPPEAVVSQTHSSGRVADIRASVCDHGHFFASADAARPWLAEHPEGRVVAIGEAFAAARTGCQQLGWVRSAAQA